MCNVRLYITCLQKNSEKQIIIKKVDCVALISLMSLDQFTLFVANAIFSTLLCNVRLYIIFLQIEIGQNQPRSSMPEGGDP